MLGSLLRHQRRWRAVHRLPVRRWRSGRGGDERWQIGFAVSDRLGKYVDRAVRNPHTASDSRKMGSVVTPGVRGRHRGGLGQVVRVVKLTGDERPVQYASSPIGLDVKVLCMSGGMPGAPLQMTMVEAGSDQTQDLRKVRLVTLSGYGDAIELRTAGGHGYGEPLERSVSLLEHDLAHDYVSREHAETEYGCIFDAEGRLDPVQTEVNRERLRSIATGNAPEISAA